MSANINKQSLAKKYMSRSAKSAAPAPAPKMSRMAASSSTPSSNRGSTQEEDKFDAMGCATETPRSRPVSFGGRGGRGGGRSGGLGGSQGVGRGGSRGGFQS